jgi:hypothetical protein
MNCVWAALDWQGSDCGSVRVCACASWRLKMVCGPCSAALLIYGEGIAWAFWVVDFVSENSTALSAG